jgi:hypothetical protein
MVVVDQLADPKKQGASGPASAWIRRSSSSASSPLTGTAPGGAHSAAATTSHAVV